MTCGPRIGNAWDWDSCSADWPRLLLCAAADHCFAALLLLCFCARPMCSALHRTDIQLLRAPKFASSSTVTNSYTSIGTRAHTCARCTLTNWWRRTQPKQPVASSAISLFLARTHTHTHTYVHSFLSLLALHCGCSLWGNVLFLHCAHFAFCI